MLWNTLIIYFIILFFLGYDFSVIENKDTCQHGNNDDLGNLDDVNFSAL